MTIKLKNRADFNHAVTYLINQTYCFDRYDTQLMIRFPQVMQGTSALEELTAQDIWVSTVEIDLLPVL